MCKELEEFRSVVSALAKDKSSVGKKNITAKRFKEWQKELTHSTNRILMWN